MLLLILMQNTDADLDLDSGCYCTVLVKVTNDCLLWFATMLLVYEGNGGCDGNE